MPRVLAVCAVHELHPDAGPVGVTGIDKRPLDGPVRVGPYGVRADVQASRRHHGGLDKAVYAYAQEDAEFWEQELGRAVPPGLFGENLRTEGIDVNAVVVGEQWQVGERLILEVTSPRTPCATFARWLGAPHERGWVKRFADERRLGPYFRVVRSGDAQAGDEIVVLSRPEAAPTILDVFAGRS
ncbi:MOSC domain-containing protein [Microbacterium caowuchunii]|uniref:MOSC domain-containing protein n=1 Tax=Microbacterium caowuchunii TaxID=2614638 RepID=A0A5N0T6D3_9MICO|nr:MOSC domain-containing protein [Microbacterium caowuchunii]KAA9130620.1 MOSC domain-containing protein [Microbacterium caowuchunii]